MNNKSTTHDFPNNRLQLLFLIKVLNTNYPYNYTNNYLNRPNKPSQLWQQTTAFVESILIFFHVIKKL